jgi:glycosyltransferase involved in cell wall biosynthesis
MGMKVFYQYSTAERLIPTRGDMITEISTIKALETFADVTYGGDPTEDYDIYYVRANPDVFSRIPDNKPCIYFASPYNEYCFGKASAIATFTDAWTRYLTDGVLIDDYGVPLKYDKVVTMHQTLTGGFEPKQNDGRTMNIRSEIGGDFIIGHFGRIANSCYPHSFLHILPKIREKHPGVRVMFAGQPLGHPNIIHKQFDYKDMPYAISACDLILYNYRTRSPAFVAGSMKVLESMACGVPVLAPMGDARVEQLGNDYEMFHPFTKNGGRYPPQIEKIMFEKISNLIDDEELRANISERLVKRAEFYNLENSSKRLKTLFEGLISSS